MSVITNEPEEATMLHAIRGNFLDFTGDPFFKKEEECARYTPDGLLVTENGVIKELGPYNSIAPKYPNCETDHYPGCLIMPGFIDTHVHYPQMGIIASYGEQLLTWLNKYVFPEEARFADESFAREAASLFLDELLRNGTTTAAVFATVHPQSVEAFFTEAHKRNMRMIAGKVMMDREAPEYLLDTPEQSYKQSRELILKWHGTGRQLYAVTPRFAITSSPDQLSAAGRLKEEFPEIYVHTHLAETQKEISYTLELYPDCPDYLNVYETHRLVTSRSIFAHCIHLSDSEFQRLSNAGSTIAFCPTSNLFLGSGLFNHARAKSRANPVHVGIGTDVGGGDSISLLRTLNEAYKVASLQNHSLSALRGIYLLTLGAARSLSLDHKIGSFDPGKEADLVVLDPNATGLLRFRGREHSQDNPPGIAMVTHQLFGLMCLGDDRVIKATYINGSPLYKSAGT